MAIELTGKEHLFLSLAMHYAIENHDEFKEIYGDFDEDSFVSIFKKCLADIDQQRQENPYERFTKLN